ncbi:MAG: hypothetical protein HZC11_01265 [Nitrospirae bacterium]|nr:hypothetical protein [Nitrospirota bacterium]
MGVFSIIVSLTIGLTLYFYNRYDKLPIGRAVKENKVAEALLENEMIWKITKGIKGIFYKKLICKEWSSIGWQEKVNRLREIDRKGIVLLRLPPETYVLKINEVCNWGGKGGMDTASVPIIIEGIIHSKKEGGE